MLDVTLGEPRRRDAFTLFPLISTVEAELPYPLLAQAIATGTVRISEVGQGTVPRLFAKNAGDAAVLILDGEQLIGARQNRMTNRSILLPPNSETEIPVSCMEQGRWHFVSDAFESAPQHSPAAVRRKVREVEAYYAASGMAVNQATLADAQGDVWEAIVDLERRLAVDSPTKALDNTYRAVGRDLDAWAAASPPLPGQVGLLGMIEDRPIGLDVIGGRELYRRLHDRLLRGYLLDALEALRSRQLSRQTELDPGDDGSASTAARNFLRTVREATRTEAESVGIGLYMVISGDAVGGELLDNTAADARLAHLSAFPLQQRSRRSVD